MRIKKSKVILFGDNYTPYKDIGLIPENQEHEALYNNLQHMLQNFEYDITTISFYRFKGTLYTLCLKKEKGEKKLYVEVNREYIEIGRVYDCPSRRAEGFQLYDCTRVKDVIPKEHKFDRKLRDFIKLVGRVYVEICKAYGIQYVSDYRRLFNNIIITEN